MSTRNLDALLRPRSVALIGASARPGSVGAALVRNLGNGRFGGRLYCVHDGDAMFEGFATFSSLAEVPEAPDLVVIATPAPTVPALVAEAAQRGARAAVVISSGFAELGPAGATLQQALLEAARPHLLRVLGPNGLGLIRPALGLNASFSHIAPAPGRLALLAQSGAVIAAALDWAAPREIGFSHVLSLGDMADVDFGDLLDWLAEDPETHAVLLYVEGITQARKFMSAARAAARCKPVLVLKGGRFAASAQAAFSHTGAMVGDDDVYSAAFRRAGIVRVDDLDDLFATAAVLGRHPAPEDRPLTIVSNGGGMGVLASDALLGGGGRLVTLSADTVAALDGVLPATWSRANPVDVIGDAGPDRYADVLRVLAAAPECGPVLVLNCPTGAQDSVAVAQAVIDHAREHSRQTLLAAWVGDATARAAWQHFESAGVPVYAMPETAVRAYLRLIAYRRGQDLLMETPPALADAVAPEAARARALLDAALDAGEKTLSQGQILALLRCYGVPVVDSRLVTDPEAAGVAAAEFGGPVALKIVSPDIPHKTDAGGVALNLTGADAVTAAARAMWTRIVAARPEARIEGLLVEPMVARGAGVELILGALDSPIFGPVMLFGHGGTAAERIADRALELPPLNRALAQRLMARTRVWRLLQPARGEPGVDVDGVVRVLVALSRLLADLPMVRELEINPLLATADGVRALDARARIAASADDDTRWAIRPVPAGLTTRITTAGGRSFTLRPIVPEDEPALRRGFAGLSPEDVRRRFFVVMRELSHAQAARLTQIDYDREMALVLTDPDTTPGADLYGVVRMATDPDLTRAEFAILVRRDMTGQGLGHRLMTAIIDYARGRGIGELFGDVLADNREMRTLARDLGFRVAVKADDPGVLSLSLRLDTAAAAAPSDTCLHRMERAV